MLTPKDAILFKIVRTCAMMPKAAILFKIVHTCAKECLILKYKYVQNPWYKCFQTWYQRRDQTLNLGWAKEEHFFVFPVPSNNIFSHLSSIFPHFLPQFGPLDGWLTHLGRPWLCHWMICLWSIGVKQLKICFLMDSWIRRSSHLWYEMK